MINHPGRELAERLGFVFHAHDVTKPLAFYTMGNFTLLAESVNGKTIGELSFVKSTGSITSIRGFDFTEGNILAALALIKAEAGE